jgi:hypothetical protein
MGYLVKYRGLDVVCETLDDIDKLADRLSNKSVALTQSTVSAIPSQQWFAQVAQSIVIPTENPVSAGFRRLKTNQRRLLDIIVGSRDPVSDEDIRNKMGLANNHSISGLTTGIKRNFKRAGIKDLLQKEAKRNGSGNLHSYYSVNPKFIEELREELSH